MYHIACGCSQVPRINFFENYSQVVNHLTFCILLLIVLNFGYSAKIVDVETYFFYGDLEEGIYIECPQGMSNIKKEQLHHFKQVHLWSCSSSSPILQKGCWNPEEFQFCWRQYQPMPLCQKECKGYSIHSFVCKDNLMIGDIVTIHDAIEALKNKRLIFKTLEGLQDYLPCMIWISDDKKCAWLGQSHLIKNLENKFGGLVHEVQSHRAPSTPKFLIIRPMEENEKISTQDQWDYWLSVGMLLHLVKHLCPDLAKVTREL